MTDLRGQRVLVLGGRDGQRLLRASRALGSDATTAEVDATDRAALEVLMAASAPLDHLVLSLASGRGAGLFRDLDLRDLRAVLEGKLLAYLEAAQAALPHLCPAGSILMVTAGSARMAAPATVGLAAGNGALNAVVGPLALELAPIRVNAICPGIVETPIFDRWPEKIAAMALAVLSNRFMTDAVIDCDGGLRLDG